MFSQTIILIPTLNERKNLEKLIPAIFGLMPEVSVLVVDDNSQDETESYLKSLGYPKLYILERKSDFGYGKACINGFKWILEKDFKYIITMDADFSHDYKVIPELLNKLTENDIVIGSRYVSGGNIENWRWPRRILSRFANLYVRLILGLKIRDITAGFNAYQSSIFSKIDLNSIKSDGYAFLVELKFRLSKAGAKITEFPITFFERREGQSKMSGKVIWESIRLPWKLLKS